MTDNNDVDADYELFMPFTIVESQGGPYPDEAFVVGYELGLLDAELQICASLGQGGAVPRGRYVHTQGVPQIDLIAMRYGYTIELPEGRNDEEWSWVEFNPVEYDGG